MRLRIPFPLLITALFVLALGIFTRLYLADSEQQTHQIVEKMESNKLCLLDENDSVTRIWIKNASETEPLALEKKDGRWQLTEPVDYPAEPQLVEGMVTALTASVKVRNLERQGNWSEYGLEKPNLEIKIRTEKSPQDRSLYFGNPSPTSGLVFARWANDSDDYFLLPEAIQQVFSRSLYALRSKKIFDGSGTDITKVHLRTFKGDYEISRHKNQWFWMEPIPILGEVVSPEDLKEFWNRLEQLYVKEFMDDPFADLTKFGIREEGAVIKLTEGENESAKDQMLFIGSEVAEKQAFYAKRNNLDNPYLVASPNVNHIFEEIETMALKAVPKQTAVSEAVPAPLLNSASVLPEKSERSQASVVPVAPSKESNKAQATIQPPKE